VDGSGSQQQHARAAHEIGKREIPIGGGIARVMGFIDHDNLQTVAVVARPAHRPRATQALERDQLHFSARRRQGITPHRHQCSWRNDRAAAKSRGNRQADVGLTHADFIAKERTAESVDRFAKPRHRRHLVRMELHGSDARGGCGLPEHGACNSRSHCGRRR